MPRSISKPPTSIMGLTGFTVFVLLATSISSPGAVLPIAGTGYNRASIVNGPSAATGDSSAIQTAITNSTNGTLDGSYDFYAVGFSSSNPTTGLPVGSTFVSASNSAVTFAIQSASPSAPTNNLFFLNSSTATATFTLSTPSNYGALSFLVAGFNGNQSGTYSLNYSVGSPVTGSFTADDNFDNSPFALIMGGRVCVVARGQDAANSFANLGSSDPRLYEVDLTGLDTSRVLNSITFGGTLTNDSAYGVFGVSGAVPEPSAWTLLLGCIGLLGSQRFRRTRPE